MSTYHTTESALLALVRGYNAGATFTAQNSSVDEWRVLDASGADASAVIEMGAASKEGENLSAFGNETQSGGYGSQGSYNEMHTLDVWLCVKRAQGKGGDGAAKAACKTLTEAVKDYVRRYEQLGHGAPILRARIVTTSPPSYISPSDDITRATHVAQQISIRVMCEAMSDPIEMGV